MIKSTINVNDQKFQVECEDCDDFSILPLEQCGQVYGVCFVGEQMVIAKNGKKNTWGLPGGSVEKGESIEQTLRREIQEETNMRVLKFLPIGYQKVIRPDGSFVYQLRVVAMVKPLGEFTHDPGGHISEIKLINPTDYRQYFDWGKIGDRILRRGIELKSRL